ncbi:MAG: MBL fold metallo-hydrolase [Candidatus Kapabacteria bacterium]|nr:MBL fold metallo-hydrolase [Candidatus Kapabacteria bacterium]
MKKYILILLLLIKCFLLQAENFTQTDHYNGNGFFNLDSGSFVIWDFLKWQLEGSPKGLWFKDDNFIYQPAPPKRVFGSQLRATWINHATVLIQTNGLNILTDPVWSETIGPVSWLNPARYHLPGIKFEDLPPIDIVLISHNHFDHLDIPTIEMLVAKHNPKFIVPLGLKSLLESAGAKDIVPLDWWHNSKIKDSVSIYFVPARHYSMRGLFDSGETLWGGFVVQASGGNIYYTGDTGMGRHFKMINDKFGHMRFSLIPIGPYRPAWIMHWVHISPMEAVQVHKIVNSKTSMAVHFGTFRQGDDYQNECPILLNQTLKQQKIRKKNFFVPEFGKGYIIE